MLFKIVLICDEVEDFLREITIDTEATFLDLNKAILDSCSFPDDQMTSFYLCDEDWTQKTQVTREDMDAGAADEDIYVMEDTKLNELIEDDGQRLIYIFDPFNDRCFYLNVKEIVPHRTLRDPVCSMSRGKAPKQLLDFDDPTPLLKKLKGDDLVADEEAAMDEEFFGREGFDVEDFDPESTEFSDEPPV